MNEKYFCFVIPFFNNEKWINKCLSSVYQQTFTNFRIIFINDNSNDNSIDQIYEFLQDKSINYKIINNDLNYGPAFSRLQAFNEIKDHEIVIFLDGDDWLFHEDVLKELNDLYSNNDIEMTVGSYKKYNSKISIFTFKVREINLFCPTRYHLRTGYGHLWNDMILNDIFFQNKPIRYLSDFNEILYALKKTNKIYFCKNPLMVYNISGPSTELVDQKYKNDVYNFLLLKFA